VVRNAPNTTKKISRPDGAPSVAGMVESIVGCKWSVSVLARIRAGVHRPGQLERSIDGISTKVLSERLDKLLRFGLVDRTAYPEVPPRVEYRLTALGERFCGLIDEVERLEQDLAGP
jgi:DNA-binding HxlR family transcriptional regulator